MVHDIKNCQGKIGDKFYHVQFYCIYLDVNLFVDQHPSIFLHFWKEGKIPSQKHVRLPYTLI